MAQPGSLAGDVLTLVCKQGTRLFDGAADLIYRSRFILDAFHLIIKGRQHFRRLAVRMNNDGDTVKVWINRRNGIAANSNSQFLLNQSPVQAGSFIGKASTAKDIQPAWPSQQAIQYRQGEEIGIVPCRSVIGNFEVGCLAGNLRP